MKQRHQQRKMHNKSVRAVMTAILFVVTISTGCSNSGKTPSTPAPVAPKQAQQPISRVTATTVAEEKSAPVFTYNPAGRRDPFAPIVIKEEKKAKTGELPPLERYNLSEFRMTGIIWGGFGYNAMLEGPDGKGYLVRVGTVLGPNKGMVKKITQSTIVVEEKFKSITGATERREIVIELRKKQEGTQ